MKNIAITYRFELEDGSHDVYELAMDRERLRIVNPTDSQLPRWTQLECHQCVNCPLDRVDVPHCPAAVNLVGVVRRFDRLLSFHRTHVTVETAERQVSRDVSVQRGVSSLIGLLMAASDCPHMAFFKPMARFHLPFASTEETIWRAISAYMLAQYFSFQQGHQPDAHLDGLTLIYDEIQDVNESFAKRLRVACQFDSMVNALILLDMFAKSLPEAIDESLAAMRHLFMPYLEAQPLLAGTGPANR